MRTIQQQIVALAKAAGYDGDGPLTVRGALDALADAVNGSDKAVPHDVAGAAGAMSGLIFKQPSGTLTITENGEGIDVSQYAYVTVDVAAAADGGGDS